MEGRGGVSGKGCHKRSEGDGSILPFPHKPLCYLASLWGMGRNSVFKSFSMCMGGGMDLDFRCCEQKDFVAAPSQGLRQTLCSF